MADPVKSSGVLSSYSFDAPSHSGPAAPGKSPPPTACPTIGLAAVVTDGGAELSIWRGNGEMVSRKARQPGGAKIDSMCWKSDGQLLAVGWSDGVVRLLAIENNKQAVHSMRMAEAGDKGESKFTHIAWCRNQLGHAHNPRGRPESTSSSDPADLPDLPNELVFLDVESSLPKLSPLPVSAGSGEESHLFSSSILLDTLFKPLSVDDSDSVDIMVVGTADGRIHLCLYDCFIIGTPSLPLSSLYLASHASNARNLLRYITQTVAHMAQAWESTRDLPRRFLNSIGEDLANSEGGFKTLLQAFTHQISTGHVHPKVREWLTDIVGERGYKRWDKAVSGGIEALRSLTHQNLLPALERCGLVASRLLGIARYHGVRTDIGFSAAQVSRILDCLAALSLAANRVLVLAMEEGDLFAAFSSWFHFQVERLAVPQMTEELTEKETGMDHSKTLAYVQRFLFDSPLSTFLNKLADPNDRTLRGDMAKAEDGIALLPALDKQLKKRNLSKDYISSLPRLEFLVKVLAHRTEAVTNGIAATQRKSVRFDTPIALNPGANIRNAVVRMCPAAKKNRWYTYVAISVEEPKSQLSVFRIQLDIVNGVSRTLSTEASSFTLGTGRLIDMAFLDDHGLLVIWAGQAGSPASLVRLPMHSVLNLQAYESGSRIEVQQLEDWQVRKLVLGELPDDTHFVPANLEVHPPSASFGQLPARACILGKDGKRYKVLAVS